MSAGFLYTSINDSAMLIAEHVFPTPVPCIIKMLLYSVYGEIRFLRNFCVLLS